MTNKEEMQDLLNRSVAHIRAQGRPSVKFENPEQGQTCMYRSPQGLACAAAPFITEYDQNMDDGMEAGAWTGTFTNYWQDRLEPLAVKHQPFVRQLQLCHDEASKFRNDFPAKYEKLVAELAAMEGLTVPPMLNS